MAPTDIAKRSHVTPLPRYSIEPSDLLETKNASANECVPSPADANEFRNIADDAINVGVL